MSVVVITGLAQGMGREVAGRLAAAGDTVVYGDAGRREALVAAGLMRASVLIVSYADPDSALRVLAQVHALRPELPVVVRAADESDFDRLVKQLEQDGKKNKGGSQ